MATQAASESAIASVFLKEIGAPDTDLMRKAVTAWLRKESGSKVIGNNPWNISLGAAKGLGVEPTGYRTHSRTGQKFAIYGSMADGTRAAARLLLRGNNPKDTRGYAGVIAGARSGDPIAFLNGLAASKWSADKYGGVGNNSLIRVYKSVTGLRNVTQIGGAKLVPPSEAFGASLGAFGDLIKFPIGKIITETDVDAMMKTLEDNHKFDTGIPIFGVIVTGEARAKTREILMGYVGKPWSKATQDEVQGTFSAKADEAAENPLGIPGLGNLVDPGFWARILALIGGVALVGFGVIR